MNTFSPYHFHKFEDTKQQGRSLNEWSKIMPMYRTMNSYTNINRSPSRFQTGFIPIKGSLFSQGIHETDTTKPFPFSEIISLNFEQILRNGSITVIEPYLQKMLHHKFKTSSNSNLVVLLSSFQHLLNYLFQIQTNIIQSNNELETSINSKSSWINQQITSKERTISENNAFTHDLINKQYDLNRKINVYKSVLYSNGYQKLISNMGPLKIKQGRYYYCDLCSNRKFSSYESVHSHYVKKHFRGAVSNMNQSNVNFQKLYFDNKLDMMKEELLQSFYSMNNTKRYGGGDDFRQSIGINNSRRQERIIKPLRSSQTPDTRPNVTIKHYSPSIQRSSIRQKTVDQFPRNESTKITDIINQLENKHERNIKVLINEMNKFKQDIFDRISGINVTKDQKITSIVINPKNQTHNTSHNRYQSDANSKQIAITESKIDISDNHSINKADQFVIESQRQTSPQLKKDSIIEVAPDMSDNKKMMLNAIEKYKKRDNNIINNKHTQSIIGISREYNIFNLTNTNEIGQSVNKEIEKQSKERDLVINVNYNTDKTPYGTIINNILRENIELSNENFAYAKYKDTIYSIIDIKQYIEFLGENIKNEIYLNIDINKIYDFCGS